MTSEKLLMHANRFEFELRPGFLLIIYKTAGGFLAHVYAETRHAEGGGFLVTDEMLEWNGKHLRHDGTYAHGGMTHDPAFYFNSLPVLLAAAGIIPNEDQRDKLTHSLGLDPRRPRREPYRDYYCATKGDPRLEAMVAKGWMRHGCVINDGRDQYYHVTEAGAESVGSRLPKEKVCSISKR